MLIAQVVFSYQAYGYICLHSYVWAICPERASIWRPCKDCALTEDYTLIKACTSTKVCTLTKACTLSKDYALNKACTLNQSLHVDRRLCVIGRWREVRKIPSQPKDYILYRKIIFYSQDFWWRVNRFYFFMGGAVFFKKSCFTCFRVQSKVKAAHIHLLKPYLCESR